MKATEFCYWLQGMFEINPVNDGLNKEQTEMVKNHLNMVFIHDIDPSYPTEQQDSLNTTHGKIGGSYTRPDGTIVNLRC